MSRSPFPRGGTPPHWWNGFEPSHDWLKDLNQRLTFLYGDANARFAGQADDIEAWRRLGRSAP